MHVGVVNMHTIKPTDSVLLRKLARKTGRILAVEDHGVVGGLGSAVLEVLGDLPDVVVHTQGVRGYGESGTHEELYARHRLDAAGIGPAHDLVVIHVSAGNPFRRWPPASFTDLAVRLSSGRTNRRIILSSGPSDAKAAAEIGQAARARLGSESAAIVDFGDLSLAELRSLIGRASLFVGGDSGPMHVAATTDTPVVALFDPTLREQYGEKHCNAQFCVHDAQEIVLFIRLK